MILAGIKPREDRDLGSFRTLVGGRRFSILKEGRRKFLSAMANRLLVLLYVKENLFAKRLKRLEILCRGLEGSVGGCGGRWVHLSG